MRTRAALGVSCLVVVLVVVLDHRTMVGAIAVLAFLALAPGAALSRVLGLRGRDDDRGGDRVVALVVAIGTSFAIDALVAEAMMYARVWTAARALLALAALVAALVVVEHLRRGRTPATAPDGGSR